MQPSSAPLIPLNTLEDAPAAAELDLLRRIRVIGTPENPAVTFAAASLLNVARGAP